MAVIPVAKIETTAFDSADYLNSAEAIAAYLDAYLYVGRFIDAKVQAVRDRRAGK